MIDIRSKMLDFQLKRKREYISVFELINLLKENNKGVFYSEIATYLLVELSSYDVVDIDDGFYNDELVRWEDEHGIAAFIVPSSLTKPVERVCPSPFFEILHDLSSDTTSDQIGELYLSEAHRDIFVERWRIEAILNIKTLDENELEKSYLEAQSREIAMALTKTDEFIKNTDINKSPVGVAERLAFEEKLNEKNAIISNLQTEIKRLQTKLAPTEIVQPKQTRTSQPQRDIFTLLVLNNYPNRNSRNELFSMINADMREKGIITRDIKYTTFDNLIDENIRLNKNGLSQSPFPPKQK